MKDDKILVLFLAAIVGMVGMVGFWGIAFADDKWTHADGPPPPGPDFCGVGTVCYLEYRGTVGAVFNNGRLSHCKIHFCIDGGPYTEDGTLTMADMMRITECDPEDVLEAYAVAARFKAMNNETRMHVEIGDAA